MTSPDEGAALTPGKLVKQLRTRRGLSHDKLAAILGTSRQRLIAWEKESSGISEIYAEKLAEWSGLPVEEFETASNGNGDGVSEVVSQLVESVAQLAMQLLEVQERLDVLEQRQDPPSAP